MASTNEDVIVLATAPSEDGNQVLVLRHLPDRGTVEIGWGSRESGAIVPASAVLEVAAEAIEIDAVMRLCERLLADASWEAAGEGRALDETPPDGAEPGRCSASRAFGPRGEPSPASRPWRCWPRDKCAPRLPTTSRPSAPSCTRSLVWPPDQAEAVQQFARRADATESANETNRRASNSSQKLGL